MFRVLPRRSAVLLACALGGFLLTGPAAHADDAKITIDNFSFSPAVLTVAAGTKVVWTNNDDIPHTVVDAGATPPEWRSKAMDTDDSFSRVFDKPGTYKYFCGLHPHMQGTVVVT